MQSNFQSFLEKINKHSFSQMSEETKKKFFRDNGFDEYCHLICSTQQETKINLQKFVKKIHCVICGVLLHGRRKKVCSDLCGRQRKSNFQTTNNSSHKMTLETKNIMKQKLSVMMSQKIIDGKFTPKSENYKTFGTIDFLHEGQIRKVRSLWELIYWLKFPNLQYEKIRIPYYDSFQQKNRVYITDFYDEITNTIYEIKPKKYQYTLKDKEPAVISHGYNYIIVDENFFNKTIKTEELITKISQCVINQEKITNRLKWLKK